MCKKSRKVESGEDEIVLQKDLSPCFHQCPCATVCACVAFTFKKWEKYPSVWQQELPQFWPDNSNNGKSFCAETQKSKDRTTHEIQYCMWALIWCNLTVNWLKTSKYTERLLLFCDYLYPNQRKAFCNLSTSVFFSQQLRCNKTLNWKAFSLTCLGFFL